MMNQPQVQNQGTTEPVLFVSLQGDDGWSGHRAEPNMAKTDGPLRTFEAAQSVVRRLKSTLKVPVTIKVMIRGGVYELNQTLVFSALDSGFPRAHERLAQTWPVIWMAYPGETPVLSGGSRITTPWRIETVHGRAAWVTELTEVARDRWYFKQLWVNGQRRQRPSLPKQGLAHVTHVPDTDYQAFWINAGSSRCGFKVGDLKASWHNVRDLELQFFGWWNAPRVGVTTIDEANGVVWFDRNSMLRLGYAENDGLEYRVINVFEALTDPGEWYLDHSTGKLTYLPLDGEDVSTAEMVAPRLESLVLLDGVSNLTFEGLTFSHNEWKPPADYADSVQASFEVPGAIIVRHGDHCVFTSCHIRHTNTYGVEFEQGTIEGVLDHCELRDLGAGGVKIWHGCRRNVVTDCHIFDGGNVWAAGVGVLIGRSTGNRIEHNHIHDFYYSGISAGWNWGYTESDSYGNIIEWNHIHDLGKGLLSDMGGIYLLGHATGTRLRYNHIHAITCRRYGGWCIYTDEGSCDVLIEGNVCHDTNENAFNQHYGKNNQVRGNIFAFGGKSVLSYGKPEPHSGLVFESNIFLARSGTHIARDTAPDRWGSANGAFRKNLYWAEGGPVIFQRGGPQVYGSQAFPAGYKAAANQFTLLEKVPAIIHPPLPDDWSKAKVWSYFCNQPGTVECARDRAEVRFLRHDSKLLIRGYFKRFRLHEPSTGTLFVREHCEFFLKPFADLPGMVQLGVAADGETVVVWHDCSAPAHFSWHAEVTTTPEGWQATLSIPDDSIVSAVRSSAGLPAIAVWRFLVGFTTGDEIADWADWQAQGHDPAGLVADPLFVDPTRGDFRLRPESPARPLGFLPVDVSLTGPRR